MLRLFCDGLNRLTSEATTALEASAPLGTVSYTYDNASRPATMTAGNNPEVAYTFAAGNRLTAISSGGTAAVCLGYDAANRSTLLVLPGSVSASYAYDSASELTGLAYTYDNAARRATAAGTLFSSVAPGGVTSTTYNADNQLTALTTPSGTINPTWDLNGNLTNDGTSAYTWDVRNRLLAVGSLASFAYDAAGRRLSLTPGGGSTQYYLYG